MDERGEKGINRFVVYVATDECPCALRCGNIAFGCGYKAKREIETDGRDARCRRVEKGAWMA